MRYQKYSSAEIPWVMQIPSHWSQIRNDAFFTWHQDKVGPDYKKYKLLSLTTQGVRCKSIEDATGKVPTSYEGYQKVNSGDMVFCLFDLDCSAVFSGISNYFGMITSAYDVMTPDDSIVNPRFIDYWFQSVFAGRHYKIFAKSVRYTINYDIFKALKTPVPPRAEQDQIVRYLDWKVAQINKLIHGYQREIGLIEEKENLKICDLLLHGLDQTVSFINPGIQNIDRIPSHWKVLQSKRLFNERSEFSTQGNETLLSVSKHYGVKRYSDLDTAEQFATIKPAQSLIGYKKVHQYDLAMNIMRARNGSYGISDYDGIVSPAYCVYQLIYDCNPQYIHYLLHTPQIISCFESYSYGIAEHRRRLYPTDFLRLYFPIPPKAEQNKIVERVLEIKSESTIIIDKLKRQITLLREYRTRLISDVVTGQMDVRGIAVPDFVPEEDVEPEREENEEETEMDEDAQ